MASNTSANLTKFNSKTTSQSVAPISTIPPTNRNNYLARRSIASTINVAPTKTTSAATTALNEEIKRLKDKNVSLQEKVFYFFFLIKIFLVKRHDRKYFGI